MAITQVGSEVTVAFNGITYTGFQMEDSSGAITGDIDEIRNDDNDMVTKLISNKGHRYRLTGVVKNVASDDAELTALRAIVKGATLAVNGTNCMVTVHIPKAAWKPTNKTKNSGKNIGWR